MILFGCGTCGLSMLSQGIPFVETWSVLLLVAFALYLAQNLSGRCQGKSLVESVLAFAVFLVLSLVMLSSILLPLAAVVALLVFARRACSADRVVRVSSVLLLCAFATTAAYGVWNKQRLGEDYPLSCIQAGGPGYAFFSQTARQEPFPRERYLKLYTDGSSREALNVMKVFHARPRVLDDDERASELSDLKALLGLRPGKEDHELQKTIHEYELAKPKPIDSVDVPQKNSVN